MMADGGFSVEGQENEQEILSKRLYLCQFHVALAILRHEGHFVCKLFDIFTPFSVGLVYLMYLAFEQVCIFKPNTSRPANSERYIVCKWLKEGTKDIADYLYEVNCLLDKFSYEENQDIREIVPLSILKNNVEFYNYIVNSNNKFGSRQIVHLDKIKVYAKNPNLHEANQADYRRDCLKLWGIPDQVRAAPKRPEADAKYKEIMQGEMLSFLSKQPEMLVPEAAHLFKRLVNVFDYHCVVCGESQMINPQPTLFLSLGRSNVFQLDMKHSKWSKIDLGSSSVELPSETLFYGEVIMELKGEGKGQRKMTAIHIIDVIRLGEKDVRKLHFKERMMLAEKLAKAVYKPNRNDFVPVRVKKVWSFRDVDHIFTRLAMKCTKTSYSPARLCYNIDEERHMFPTGLLIYKSTADNWITCFSKRQNNFFYYNTKTSQSVFERVQESIADFKSCYNDRIFWKWERGVRMINAQPFEADPSFVQGAGVSELVKTNLKRIIGC